MPLGKIQRSNTMLYTLLIFVALLIIAVAAAVIFYINFEKQKGIAQTAQSKLNELATGAELRKVGSLVGAKQRGKSRLGTMVDYLDEAAYLVLGGVSEDTSAEVKIDAVRKAKAELKLSAQDYADIGISDPNTAGLILITEKLKSKLDNLTNTAQTTEKRLEALQKQFDDAMAIGLEKEQALLVEKEKYQQQVNDALQDYDKLKALMEQTSSQRVKTLSDQLDEEKANRRALKQQFLKTQAEKKITEDRLKHIQQELNSLVPPPDAETAAFKPDGEIMLVDNQAKIVHLNLGADDHVYRGLTFSVYDKNMPIPKDGSGKAEIEVFNVGESISLARIIRSERKRPIILGDIIANLIWDSDKTNIFVVAGDFDLDGDGNIDYRGIEKIETLIEKWGGKAYDAVSIDADFVVLGSVPKIGRKPTFEEMETDPMAMQKYEASLKKLDLYKEVQNRARTLSIPVFNTERFLYFIGYKTQSARPGAF